MILNFLFAFDENYNKQACVAIYSLLENVDEKINIFLILDLTNNKLNIPDKINEHKNLNTLIIKEVNLTKDVYNIEFAHVSKATFYRLYLSHLFDDENIDFIYLDSDIVCVSNPIKKIKEVLDKMKLQDKSLAFVDEFYKYENDEPFLRLKMKGEKYFNAGVMFVNLNKWNENNYTHKSFEVIEELKDDAKFWDQDILNSMVDANYLSIDRTLNFKTSGLSDNTFLGNNIFIHYSGKSKPWDVGGIFEEFAMEYHKLFNELFNSSYHLVCNNRKNSIKKLINRLKFIRYFEISFIAKYYFSSIIAIIKK